MNLNNTTNMVNLELGGLYGHEVIKEMTEIIKLYDIYENGEDWNFDAKDYDPTIKKTNYIKKLIKEESRFLFGKTPTFKVTNSKGDREEACKEIEQFINGTLKNNLFSSKLVKGARDCFIGKRIAIKLHADTINKELRIMFVPSLEFIYEPFEDRADELKKIVFFHEMTEPNTGKSSQIIWKQKYEMVEGKCLLHEGFYDGYGTLIEVISDNVDLKLSGI
ncbi:MAG: phage portal protein, partial [Paraclostridium sp.]